MYLLAGIGNKGQQFNKTRHNVGFLIIDEVIQRYGFDKQNVIKQKFLPTCFLIDLATTIHENPISWQIL